MVLEGLILKNFHFEGDLLVWKGLILDNVPFERV